jgi:hypothetical protein
MSASGISDANPVTPAAWAPAPHDAAPPAQQHREQERESGNPPKATATPKPAHHTHHKVDVKA